MSESDKTDRNKGKSKSKNKKKSGCSWALRVFLLAVALSALLSFFSSTALEGTGYAVAIIVLAVFIALGIVFDMIGVAVTAADPKPFHSMAAHREKGAKEAIRLLKNANQVSSFCNDVVGDICGIVSGSTAAVIVVELQRDLSTTSILISIAVTALISGITIGGKALGKTVAINECTGVVYRGVRGTEKVSPWALVTQAVKPSGAVYWRRSPVQQSRQPLPPPPPSWNVICSPASRV